MLSKPQFGWTDITIGDWTGKLSYIDDVPTVLLNAFYNVFSNQKPEVVCFDAEGMNYWIVFDLLDTIIITEDENCQYSVSHQDIDIKELSLELCNDIHTNLEEWAHWTAEYDYNGSVDSDYFNQCRKRLCYDVFNLLDILNNKNDVTEIVC